MVDDDLVLVEETAPEVVTTVTDAPKPAKAPRAKRPSEIAKAAAKATKLATEYGDGKKPKPKTKAEDKASDITMRAMVAAVDKPKVKKLTKAGARATKAALEALTGVVEPKTKVKAKLVKDLPAVKKAAPKAKKPAKAKPVAKAAPVKAKPKAKPAKAAPKARKTAAKVVKPANLDGLTRARSRQREGYVAQGMTRAGDMAQVTLTFPPAQLTRMRAFANRGKISLSEASRQLVALGLKALKA